MALPPLLPVEQVRDRLRAIFPDGTPFRNYVTRGMAARTVFVMLYIGAVEGAQRWLRPDQVTRMTDSQAAQEDRMARETWSTVSMRPATGDIRGRWYATNTREPIRDETLRAGLVSMGAIAEREGLATDDLMLLNSTRYSPSGPRAGGSREGPHHLLDSRP